jgi:hypothetical protein
MQRREFIAGLGGAAAWSVAARAQQGDRVRRIGVLMAGDENDPVRGTKGWLSRFTQGLAELGWTEGRNLRMDVRWDGGLSPTSLLGRPSSVLFLPDRPSAASAHPIKGCPAELASGARSHARSGRVRLSLSAALRHG